MPLITNIIVSALISIVGAWGVYSFAPTSLFEHEQAPSLGTTVTTINGSDTLSSSRSVINTNFSNLNTGKFELSDWYATTSAKQLTTLAGLTSASALATVGTISSGTWHGSVVDCLYGGTGTTTPTSKQLMFGNGSSCFQVIGFGTSGQFLTSGGANTLPSWASASVDQSQAYVWTGNNRWTAAASSTLFAVLNTLYVGTTATSTIQGTATGTSTLQGNLQVLNNATTSNLTVSNSCAGCTPLATTTTSGALTTTNASITTVDATCSTGKLVGGGYTGVPAFTSASNMYVPQYSGPANTTTYEVAVICITSGSCPSGTMKVTAICAQ